MGTQKGTPGGRRETQRGRRGDAAPHIGGPPKVVVKGSSQGKALRGAWTPGEGTGRGAEVCVGDLLGRQHTE